MKKDSIIAVLFFMFPFMVLAPGIIWKGQQLFFITMGLVVIAFQIRNLYVRAFLLFGMVWQVYIFLSAFNMGINPGPGLSVILCLLAGGIIYKFVSEGMVERQAWYSVIRIVVIIQVIIGVLQLAGHNPVTILLSGITLVRADLPTHIVGTLGNRNFLALFIAATLPMFATWKAATYRGINWSVVIMVIFLLLCLSPGTMAGIIGLAIYYVAKRKPKHGAIYLAGSVIAALIFAAVYMLFINTDHLNEIRLLGQQWDELAANGDVLTDTTQGDIGRMAMWMMAGYKLFHNGWAFFIGFGPGAYWGRPYPLHSEYAAMWFQFGLVGILLMAGFIWSNIKLLIKNKDAVLLASFSAVCLDMVGNFPMEVASTAFLIAIICGLIEKERLSCLTEGNLARS